MSKKIILVLGMIFMFLLTACGGKETTANKQTGITTNDTVIKDEFKNFDGGQVAKMVGSNNKEYRLVFPEGGFLLSIKTKDLVNGLQNLSIVSSDSNIGLPFFSSYGAGMDDSGWYVYERIEHMYSDGEYIFKVEANGPYIIEVTLLPQPSLNKTLPLTITGYGTKAIGPFASNELLTVKVKTDDAKQAGFMATLHDATTGEHVEFIYVNVDLDTHIQSNQFNVTKSVNASGSYFLHINANKNCEWEVTISS